MSRTKKWIAFLLAVVLSLSLGLTAFADNGGGEDGYKDYTNVFVHGLMGWGQYDGVNNVLPYWGMSSGSMMWYLGSKGYDVVAASVGPVSSCWDRCCELFAQLTGTRTDYGEAHCAAQIAEFQSCGIDIGHERFGRDYTWNPILTGWGPVYDENGNPTGDWYSSKINLIGHSFGGPTIVKFLQLLAEGDAAEQEYAKTVYGDDWKNHCSPLFWGGNKASDLVNSLTSLAGVLNGTTFIDSCDDSTEIVTSLAVAFANAVGETDFNMLYDFQLEQFGITSSDNPSYEYTLDILRSTRFLDGKDNAIYDLSIEGCNSLKQGWNCYDGVFYFAYPGCATYDSLLGTQLPNADMWPLFMPFAIFMGSYTNGSETVLDCNGDYATAVDSAWLPNDGLVNTVSAGYVFGCDHKNYDGTVEPGKWITMPSYGYDHMDSVGGLLDVTQNTLQTTAFYDEIMNNILSTYSYSTRLEAPVLSVNNINYSSTVGVKWSKVPGATGYKLYRASSKNGTYSLIRSTTGTATIDITTLLNKTYYYKVVAVNAKDASATSPYSEIQSIKVKFLK